MISRMKRLFPILIIVLLLFQIPVSGVSAHAEEDVYAVADKRDVWFYQEPDESKGLFILPYTYYVKVLSEGDPFCRVEYQDSADGYKPLSGYCLREQLHFVDFTPVRPFLKKRITLTYSIDSGNGIGDGSFDSMERTVSYYGNFSSGTAPYYYVYADGKFDYVPATEPVTYDLNTDYIVPAGTDPDPDVTVQKNGINGLEIALVCLLCAAAVIVAFFVIRGKKAPISDRNGDEL